MWIITHPEGARVSTVPWVTFAYFSLVALRSIDFNSLGAIVGSRTYEKNK